MVLLEIHVIKVADESSFMPAMADYGHFSTFLLTIVILQSGDIHGIVCSAETRIIEQQKSVWWGV